MKSSIKEREETPFIVTHNRVLTSGETKRRIPTPPINCRQHLGNGRIVDNRRHVHGTRDIIPSPPVILTLCKSLMQTLWSLPHREAASIGAHVSFRHLSRNSVMYTGVSVQTCRRGNFDSPSTGKHVGLKITYLRRYGETPRSRDLICQKTWLHLRVCRMQCTM